MAYESNNPFVSKNDPYRSGAGVEQIGSVQAHYHSGTFDLTTKQWSGCGCSVNASSTDNVRRSVGTYVGGAIDNKDKYDGGLGVIPISDRRKENSQASIVSIVSGNDGTLSDIKAAGEVVASDFSSNVFGRRVISRFGTAFYSQKRVDTVVLPIRKSGVNTLIPHNFASPEHKKNVKKVDLVGKLFAKQ